MVAVSDAELAAEPATDVPSAGAAHAASAQVTETAAPIPNATASPPTLPTQDDARLTPGSYMQEWRG